MPTTPRQQAGSRGRRIPLPLPFFSLLLLALAPRPGQAAIHIPANLKKPPEITAQPKSLTAFSVENIMLTCEASGDPPPTFRWVKDGKEFNPASNPDLTVSADSGSFSVIVEDGPINQYQGKYTCYASNELGTAVSNEVQIITENTPTLQKEKKMQVKVDEGNSTILSCNPSYQTVPPNIHWMDKRLRHIEQSERVTQGRDGNLYFSHVTIEDSRSDYTCNMQYGRTIFSKEPVALSVTSLNTVVRNRRPQMMKPAGSHSTYLVLKGQNLELECIVQGLPTPSIQWFRKDGELPSRASTEGFNRLLLIKDVTENDAGEYQCTANNTQGKVKHTYIVSVEAAPYWTKEPESQLYAPGESARLQCQADAVPSPQITWSINGNPLTDIDPDPRRSVQVGTLTLTELELGDTAVYQCKASNKHGTILVNTYVYVIELPPQILSEDDQMYTVTEGQKVVLDCQTFGSPRPKVTWESKYLGPVISSPRVTQLTGGSLQIGNVSHDDAGIYTCSIAEAKVGISAELEVLNRTVIVSPPLHLRVQRGKAATFTCLAQVDPKLAGTQIQWRRSGKKLFESYDVDKYTFEGPDLMIADVQEDDEGIYLCEVMTSLDSAEASGSLTIIDRPDPPSKIQITDPKDRFVTLSWTPGDDHKSSVSEYVLESEETGVDSAGWEEVMRVSGASPRKELKLTPFLSYRFRVIAVNDVGNSDPSEPSEPYFTPAAAPDSNPEGVKSESTDPDTLLITWEEMDRQNLNGPEFQYKVMWRKVLGSGPSWSSNFTSTPPFVVAGVGNFTAFEIKVQAVNQQGSAPDPKSVIGYSGEDDPLESPIDVGVELLNSTAIRVKWAAVERDTVRGHLLGYRIRLWNHGPEGRHHRQERVRREPEPKNELVVDTPGNEEKKVLGGLQPYSSYSLTVSVYNSKAEGPQSEPLTFQTPEGVPSPPTSLELDSPSETEMTLRWTPPAHPNGVLTGYIVRYQQLDTEGSPMQEETVNHHSISHLTLKHLDPRSHYRFYLRGRTSVGEGLPITKEGATTLDGAPPYNISASAGETSVNLTWVARARHRNVPFSIHYIRKSDRGKWEQTEKLDSALGFYQLRGLEPGSEYRLMFIYSNGTFWEMDVVTEGAGVAQLRNTVVTEGWFIGLISALVLLLLLLLILCFIKRSKGGKYSVKDKEECQVDSEARPMKDETFGEYRSLESDNEEKRTASQPSLCEDSKLCSDDGGLDDYGNSNSVQTEVLMDESLASQYSGPRDGPEAAMA